MEQQQVAYLRDQATAYRELAGQATDAATRRELLELAATCEQVANNIEDRASAG
jgi:hypothetical protein